MQIPKIFNFENSKNFHFGKLQKLSVQEIPKMK